MDLRPIHDILNDLRSGRTTSTKLVEQCLARINDVNGEGSRVFISVDADAALQTADRIDRERSLGTTSGALAGLPISVKDLFNIAGQRTLAGSIALRNSAPAAQDCTVVERLRRAGAIIIGRTNMTEFAYSGLGLNPHYGTPSNPYDRDARRMPGGSSSGAAVSVSDGMAAVGIGTDTGGSVRIPAALCGLTGFKPTAARIPMDRMVPLSPSLDSVGPIAPTVQCCALVDSVLSGDGTSTLAPPPLTDLRFGLLQGYVLDGLDASVHSAFERSIRILKEAGACIEPAIFSDLDRIPFANQFAAAEAFAWHRDLIASSASLYDPHVLYRIQPGAEMSATEYTRLLALRSEIRANAASAFAGFDAILLPATQWTAPKISDLEGSDDAYFHANGAMLRNTSIFNYLDGCALSIPMHQPSEPPSGLMIAGLAHTDQTVLAAGAASERILRNSLR